MQKEEVNRETKKQRNKVTQREEPLLTLTHAQQSHQSRASAARHKERVIPFGHRPQVTPDEVEMVHMVTRRLRKRRSLTNWINSSDDQVYAIFVI